MIVSVYSRKGGVGKTTTAVNLAAALAELDLRVLLVDLDPQGSASLSFGIERADFAPSIAEVLLRSKSVADVLRSSDVPGLDVITSSADLNLIESSMTGEKRPFEIVAKALEPVREMYHFILLDVAPNLGLLARAALVASDSFLVPTEPAFLSHEGVQNSIEIARRCCHQAGTRTNLAGVVVNRCRPNVAQHQRVIESLREQHGPDLLDNYIPSSMAITEAPANGQPVTVDSPASEAAEAYRLVASELCQRSGVELSELHAVASNDDRSGTSWVSPFPDSAN